MKIQSHRQEFYNPDEILKEVGGKIEKAKAFGESIDYLTFVPDGEPTLDVNLGREIELLKSYGIKVAVITNASLIWRAAVRADLMKADWISLKVDSIRDDVWRRINRPRRNLQLESILDGMIEFAQGYRGELVSETMLVKDLNDDTEHIQKVADFLAQLKPAKTYLTVPTRPPAEELVRPPDESEIIQAYQIFRKKIDCVEYLIGYEGNAFAFTGNVKEDLLGITAVHPMKEEAVRTFLERANADWSVIQELIDQGVFIETEYEGNKFYMRRIR
ncbi:MAG: radical SAM protein [Candidatus Brocadiaceae bacterium]|nr:radical SAM protein [Candidatus Brocadiaceae bacterium]